MNCIGCKYEPEWGKYPFAEGVGECKWPCPPCLKKLMRPIDKNKPFDCPVFEKKELKIWRTWVCSECGKSTPITTSVRIEQSWVFCIYCGCNEMREEEI